MSGMGSQLTEWAQKRAASRFPLLIVAVVSGLLAFLFFIMATMDLRRIENVLVGMLEKQGFYQAEHLGEYAVYGYRQLVQTDREPFGTDPALPLEEGALSIQEQLVTELVDAARDIELMERTGAGFSAEALHHLARNRRLAGILFFDSSGGLMYGREPVPDRLMQSAQTLSAGDAGVLLRLFRGPFVRENGGYVGIRRPDGSGAVLLLLEGADLRFWAWKTAVARAMEEVQWHRDMEFAAFYDEQGRVISQAGRGQAFQPETAEALHARLDLVQGDGSMAFYSERKTGRLELTMPLGVAETPRSLVRLALSMSETEVIIGESRRHIVVSTLLMVMIGLSAMAMLYFMQNRHLKNVRGMSEQLNKARRLQSLGKLGAGMAHEIRNPLNAISMAVQRLAGEYPGTGEKKAGYDRLTEVIALETDRLNRLVDDFLTLSTSGKLRPGWHSMANVISRVLFLLQPEADSSAVRLQAKESGTPRDVLIDPDRIEQALINIIRNAFDAMPDGGALVMEVHYGNDFLTIRIADSGKGIPQADLDSIFDPSFTTRDKGVGLGLAIAHEIISAHNGEIRVKSAENHGATFEISIPVPRQAGRGHTPKEDYGHSRRG